MYLAKTIKTESGLYIYDALSNKFALVNSEQDLLDDKYYAAFCVTMILEMLKRNVNLK